MSPLSDSYLNCENYLPNYSVPILFFNGVFEEKSF